MAAVAGVFCTLTDCYAGVFFLPCSDRYQALVAGTPLSVWSKLCLEFPSIAESYFIR